MTTQPHNANPTVNVNLPRRGSSLGIASLVLGTLSFAICWIPLIGMLGIPLSGLGLILALIGVIIALTRRGSGIGFPIGGALLCGVAFAVAISLNYAIAEGVQQAGISNGSDRYQTSTPSSDISSSRRSRVGSEGRQESNTSKSTIEKSASPNTPTQAEDKVKWLGLDDPFVAPDIKIEITKVQMGLVPLKSAFGKENTSEKAALQIHLVVTNTSVSKKIEYRTLSRRQLVRSKEWATLSDNFGNDYKAINYGSMDAPQGRTHLESLYPEKFVTDVLVFEPPVGTAEFLDLQIPLKLLDMDAIGRFRIPLSEIIKEQG